VAILTFLTRLAARPAETNTEAFFLKSGAQLVASIVQVRVRTSTRKLYTNPLLYFVLFIVDDQHHYNQRDTLPIRTTLHTEWVLPYFFMVSDLLLPAAVNGVFANTQEIQGWLTTCFQNINSPFLTGEQKLRCLQLVWGYVPTHPDPHSPLTFGVSTQSEKQAAIQSAVCRSWANTEWADGRRCVGFLWSYLGTSSLRFLLVVEQYKFK